MVNESDKSYELKVLKMVINKHLDEIVLDTQADLRVYELDRDQLVYKLATAIYGQSGHKVELNIVRDIVDSRLNSMKAQAVTEPKAQLIAKNSCLVTKADPQFFSKVTDAVSQFRCDERTAIFFIQLQGIISEQLSVDASEVSLGRYSCTSKEANLDSIELCMAVEEEFDIEIIDEVWVEFSGVNYFVERPWFDSSVTSRYDAGELWIKVKELVEFICKESSKEDV